MPATPNWTITATLLDFEGSEIGSVAQPAWVRVALCGFGSQLPRIPGTALIGKVSSWFIDISYPGAQITFDLWGNDQITPSGTFYMIEILDTNRNVVQCNLYQLTGTGGTVDLSSLTPIPPPTPPPPPGYALEYVELTGTYPGTVYTLPAGALLIGLTYNGQWLFPNLTFPPYPSYTLAGVTVTMNFTTSTGDIIGALAYIPV